jgi:hypothetical protein
MTTPAPVPVVGDLLAFLNLDPGYDPDAAAEALAAALDLQRARCEVVPYCAPLREAALRRAAKILVARSAPLGQVDGGDFGAMFLPRWDALVEELEADYRQGSFA